MREKVFLVKFLFVGLNFVMNEHNFQLIVYNGNMQ